MIDIPIEIALETIAFLGVFFGVLARTILPYLQKAKQTPGLKFELRYAITFGISLFESLISALLLFGALPKEVLSGTISQFLVFITSFSWAYTSNDVINRIAA